MCCSLQMLQNGVIAFNDLGSVRIMQSRSGRYQLVFMPLAPSYNPIPLNVQVCGVSAVCGVAATWLFGQRRAVPLIQRCHFGEVALLVMLSAHGVPPPLKSEQPVLTPTAPSYSSFSLRNECPIS